jgi:uncharacterized protein (DUF1697 family)
MTTHVVLLRGINVGTAKRVSMPDLRAMATNLGYTDVATHINSGNLLLTTEEETETVCRRVEQGIEKTFELHADVVVRTVEQLAAVLAANPFPDGDPAQVTIAFLAEPPAPDAGQRIAALAADDEPYLLAGEEVYVHYGHGQADSKLAAKFAATLGVSATVRNLRTTTKLLSLALPEDFGS